MAIEAEGRRPTWPHEPRVFEGPLSNRGPVGVKHWFGLLTTRE